MRYKSPNCFTKKQKRPRIAPGPLNFIWWSLLARGWRWLGCLLVRASFIVRSFRFRRWIGRRAGRGLHGPVRWLRVFARGFRRRLAARRRDSFWRRESLRLIVRRCFAVWRCGSGFVFRFSSRLFSQWFTRLTRRRHGVRGLFRAFVFLSLFVTDRRLSEGRAVR